MCYRFNDKESSYLCSCLAFAVFLIHLFLVECEQRLAFSFYSWTGLSWKMLDGKTCSFLVQNMYSLIVFAFENSVWFVRVWKRGIYLWKMRKKLSVPSVWSLAAFLTKNWRVTYWVDFYLLALKLLGNS